MHKRIFLLVAMSFVSLNAVGSECLLNATLDSAKLVAVRMSAAEAFEKLREAEDSNNADQAVDLLENNFDMLVSIDVGLDLALDVAARHNRQDFLERIFKECNGGFQESSIGGAFSGAAFGGHKPLMEWLLTQPFNISLPNQFGVNDALTQSAKNGHRFIMEWLLTGELGIPLPDSNATFFAFVSLAEGGYIVDMQWLLTLPYDIDLPAEQCIAYALSGAARNGHQEVLDLLIAPNDLFVQPDQLAINSAFTGAADEHQVDVVRWFLARPHGISLPDQDSIIDAYRNTTALHDFGVDPVVQRALLNVLRPHVPETVRLEQEGGISHEIHNYAKQVNIKIAAHIAGRILNMVLPTEEDVKVELQSLISEKYNSEKYKSDPEKLELAQKAVLRSWDARTPEKIGQILLFLKHYHPDSLDVWVSGFVNESITAYINSQNSTSCTQGVDERILTGLRGIDAELDVIFKGPESTLLIKNFVHGKLNINNLDNLRVIASYLWGLGVRYDSDVDLVADMFKHYIESQISEHGEVTDDIFEIVTAVVDNFKDQYDDCVRPCLRIYEDQQLRAEQDREYAASLPKKEEEEKQQAESKPVPLAKEELRVARLKRFA